jgi:aspartyl-tRNA(Asn)/glutamyl-tRNA(Gln) amidotransferase subunit A
MPFSIKDLLDTADASTQRGSRLFAGFPTSIPLMKTNNPECGTWTESDNIVTGRTNNPWNLDRTAGGSSGWRGAAIAAGFSPIGIGSDLAISIRGPAAYNGIATLKATHGRIPVQGTFRPSCAGFVRSGRWPAP